MIAVQIKAESFFKIPLLGVPRKKIFVTGGEYTLSARIKNFSTEDFHGGNFLVLVRWPNKLTVKWQFGIGTLTPNEVTSVDYGTTHVLDDSPALFLVKGTDVDGQAISFCDMSANRLEPQPHEFDAGFVHIYTIIPKNAEELYQLWALIVAIISVVPIFIKDVIVPLIQWLIQAIN